RTLGRLFMRTSWMTHDWMTWWHEAALFDALIGNTDRHQDNWGILIQRLKKRTLVTLAPLFDNGTSLGHELFTQNVAAWTSDRYDFYMNRGTHHMRWEKTDAKKCKHLDLLQRMQADAGGHLPGLRQKLENFDLSSFAGQLQDLCQMVMPIPLTPDRKKLYIDLVTLRRERILKVLK
ncbi:hypothetical protein, partial [Agrobacterium pusense]|uniref:hypothetical protein n=1 Tax=Agrobacterium pusense TaxID=648995 RepID=UPI0032DA81B9